MGFVDSIVSSGVGGLVDGVAGAIDRFVETDEEKKAADVLLLKMQQEPDKWQAEINKIEAAHRSVFVAGWRPFIGWVCGVGIAWEFVGKPIGLFITSYTGSTLTLPTVATGELMTLIFALLGLGGLRSYEKKHGLAR